MALGNRIKQRLDEISMSPADLTKALGLKNNSTVHNIIARDAKSSSYAARIADVLGVRLEWLLTGALPITAGLIPNQSVVAVDLGDDKYITHQNIKRYDILLSAGGGTANWIVRENDNDPIYFRKGWFKARHLNADSLRGMYVRGDSMERYLYDHDTVIIDISDTEIIDGDIYALVFKDKFYVKELQSIDGEYLIISHNEKYPPMKTDKSEASDYNNYFQVLGRVAWRGG